MRLDLLRIHEDFYRQRCNVNVTGLGLQFEQIELSEVNINLTKMCVRGVILTLHHESLIFTEKIERISLS